MIIPLLSKHYREIGASPAVSGLIGKPARDLPRYPHRCAVIINK